MKDFFRTIVKPRGGRRIYADAAAATPLHPRVKRRLIKLLSIYGNPGALHKEAVAAQGELERARAEIASAIGAHPDEIIFTGSGTEANNLALIGTLSPLLRNPQLGGEASKLGAVTLSIEHQSVLEPLRHLKKYGLNVVELSVDADGLVSPKTLVESLTSETAIVSVQLVNSEIGVIEPLREIAKIIRRVRKERAAAGNSLPLYFHADAAQAALFMPLNVEKLGVDLLTLDAQKILGPKGIGVLYRRRGVAMEPIIFGGGEESGMRAGTANIPLAGAFAEALTLAQTGVEERAVRVASVRDFLVDEIVTRIPETQVNGSREHRVANNLNISIPGLEGETAVIAMDALGVALSTRSACGTKDEEPSYVVLALGHSRERAREAIRVTLLPDTTRDDAVRIADALLKTCELYRKH